MVRDGFLRKLSSFSRSLKTEWSGNRGYFLRFLSALSVYCLITLLVYYFLEQPPSSDADPNMVARGIDTPARLWLNGYLSLFFSFGYLGNINWIALFILFLLVKKYKKMESQQRVLLWFFICSALFIGINGFFNRRYPLTLLPFTLSGVVYFVWFNFPADRRRFYVSSIFIFLFLFIFLNNINSTLHIFNRNMAAKSPISSGSSWVHRWQKVQGLWNHRSEVADLALRKLFRNRGRFDTISEVYELKTIGYFKGLINLPGYSLIMKSKPETTIKILEQLPLKPGERILNNNLPFQFYYTSVPGWYYWCGDDDLMGPNGFVKILENRSSQEALFLLKNTWRVRYILSFDSYDYYDSRWLNLVRNYTRVVWKDPSGYIIYSL